MANKNGHVLFIRFALGSVWVLFQLHFMSAFAVARTGELQNNPQAESSPQDGKLAADITVIARRRADASIASEIEFNESDIAVEGVDSIANLLSRLQSSIDPSGQEPLLLVNGRPVGFDRSILPYPPEALARVAVLKAEAGPRYGAASTQRVVNLVLKPKFASINVDGGGNFATAGGQNGTDLGVVRYAINGDNRWDFQLRVGHQSALFKNARKIPPSSGSFDSTGYLMGLNGEEIAPALSHAAGQIVNVAAIPRSGTSAPTLADFAATANQRHPVDPNAFETLQSSSRKFSFRLGLSRPIGSFSASAALNVDRNENAGLSGIPMASLQLPAGSPWSPFDGPVILNRPFAGTRALHRASVAQSLTATLTMNGKVFGIHTSFAVESLRSAGQNLQETGVDSSRMQKLIDLGDQTFNPFGTLDDNGFLKGSRVRSRSDTFNTRINLQKSILSLPAGPLGWAFFGSAGRARSSTIQSGLIVTAPTTIRSRAAQWNGQMSLSLPISRRGSKFDTFGDLVAELSAGRAGSAGGSVGASTGASVTWRPLSQIQISGSFNHSSSRPSFSQLTNPVVVNMSRIFDFARQEFVDPVWITGGNPHLDQTRSRQQSYSLALMLQPLSQQDLSFNFRYHQLSASRGVAAFPELTPAVESAFPERVTRDSVGRLILVDARPINIERNVVANLSSSIDFRLGGARHRKIVEATTSFQRDPIQFSFSLNHQFILRDEMLIQRGLPVIDRLKSDGGASPHTVDIQFGIGQSNLGSTLGVRWSSIGRVKGEVGTFRIQQPPLFSLSMFINPDKMISRLRKNPLTRELKISFSVANLFNDYRRIRFDNSITPVGYSRDEIDPLGRTIQVTLSRRF